MTNDTTSSTTYPDVSLHDRLSPPPPIPSTSLNRHRYSDPSSTNLSAAAQFISSTLADRMSKSSGGGWQQPSSDFPAKSGTTTADFGAKSGTSADTIGTLSSSANQTKPCTKRPPQYPGGVGGSGPAGGGVAGGGVNTTSSTSAAQPRHHSHSRWRFSLDGGTTGTTKGASTSSPFTFNAIGNTSPIAIDPSSTTTYSSHNCDNTSGSQLPSPVFELTPSPETIRNFGFRPAAAAAAADMWRLQRHGHIRDWISKHHQSSTANDPKRYFDNHFIKMPYLEFSKKQGFLLEFNGDVY